MYFDKIWVLCKKKYVSVDIGIAFLERTVSETCITFTISRSLPQAFMTLVELTLTTGVMRDRKGQTYGCSKLLLDVTVLSLTVSRITSPEGGTF